MSILNYQLELTRPWWLLGLIVLPWLGWYFYRGLTDFARWQRTASLAARIVIVLLLVLSLCGLTLLKPTHEQFVVFAVDHSLSVNDEARATATEFIRKAREHQGPHQAAFLKFAAQPDLVRTDWSTITELPEAGGVSKDGDLPGDRNLQGTNLAAAIEAAAGAIPPAWVPKLVLLTDGNQTTGDALKAALQAQLPISTVVLPTRTEPEVQVSSVQVPAQVREGEPFHVEVTIDANHADEGEIEIFRGPHRVLNERHPLKQGENTFRFRQSITAERLALYSVRIKGLRQDTLLDNNSESGLVFTAGKPRVLMIESAPKLAQHLVWAMEQEGIQIDVRPPEGMPDSLADLQNYELIILSNVPATSLSQRQMEVARTYVQDLGGGLLMLGGDQSFGLGGYYKTVLEEILPVRSDFEKEKEKPSLAMVLVVDKSGSMGGDKIELAKDAAKGAVELLGPSDKIGVLAFEGDYYWASDLQPAANKGRILDDISRIEAGGGTVMAPAMEEAFTVLQSVTAKLKHVIVLTDGISAPGDFEGIASSMSSERITISTVGVGDGADEDLLQEIARIGQGRYYYANDPSSVPQIFAKETVTASKSAINELPFVPQVIRPTQALSEIDFESAPFLLGYVLTRPKPTCEFVLATEAGDPLLAWWRYGLGMTVAFTSDAKSRWAAEWLTWPGYNKFWAQVIRQAMRKSDARGITLQVQQKEGRAAITVDSIEPSGKYLNQADTGLTVIDPRMGNRKLTLQQTAPGRYTTSFETPHSGAYHLEFTQQRNGQVLYQQSRGLVVGYPDELRLRAADESLLRSLASVSGGEYAPEPEAVFAATERTARRPVPLWPYLISLAAVVFLLDVAFRRIDFTIPLLRFRRKNLIAAPALQK